MSNSLFAPTDEQKAVVEHSGSAFISACPGAGKTQVLMERCAPGVKELFDGKRISLPVFYQRRDLRTQE